MVETMSTGDDTRDQRILAAAKELVAAQLKRPRATAWVDAARLWLNTERAEPYDQALADATRDAALAARAEATGAS